MLKSGVDVNKCNWRPMSDLAIQRLSGSLLMSRKGTGQQSCEKSMWGVCHVHKMLTITIGTAIKAVIDTKLYHNNQLRDKTVKDLWMSSHFKGRGLVAGMPRGEFCHIRQAAPGEPLCTTWNWFQELGWLFGSWCSFLIFYKPTLESFTFCCLLAEFVHQEDGLDL